MQSYAQQKSAVSDETMIAYKRHILTGSAGFASAPMENLFRVNLLSQMLERHDAFAAKGMSGDACKNRVLYEYADIAARMRGQGFAENGESHSVSRWPELTEEEVAQYIDENDAYLHKQSFGIGLCSACVMPLVIGGAISELLYSDAAAMLGLVGMFIMIGLGVYAIVTAVKPKTHKMVKSGKFSLSSRVRRKLEEMRERMESKARRRRGKGIAMLVTCLIPLLLGAMIDEVIYTEAGSFLGMAGMFAMIGAGVYEIVLSEGEKKALKPFFKEKE